MVSKKVRWTLIAQFAVLFITASVLTAQSTRLTPTPENWKETATNISQVDLASQKDVVREERSSHFNARTQNVQKLDSTDSSRQMKETSFPGYLVRLPAIPVQESDGIIVGTVVSFQPYFSSDHTHIYTEFNVAVDQRIKDKTERLPPGGTAVVVREGGAIRLNDGRIAKDKIVDTNFAIAAGSRYVFFLHYVAKGQYFTVTKSWELKNGVAVPTSHEDQLDAQQGKSRFSGAGEEGFIQAVKQATTAGQDQQ